MKSSSSTALWLLSGLSAASQLPWQDCPELSTNATDVPYQCANLTVPLDYEDNCSRPLVLNLLKFPAPDQPSRGSILFNPGGPGTSGRNALYGFGPFFAAGTGVTIPVSCYADFTDRQPIDTYGLNSSDASISAAWKHAQVLTSACKTALVDTGELLGTAYVARDMERIVDALGEDGLLRLYGRAFAPQDMQYLINQISGASYGSVLGQVFAGMFPEKVDKIVIDGVVNVQQYLAGRDIQALSSTDAVWEGFLSACISRPSLCSLAKRDTSAKNLRRQIDDLLEQVQAQPLSLGPAPLSQLTANVLQTSIVVYLYNTSTWPALASGLDLLLSPINNSSTALMLQQLFGSASATTQGPFPDHSQAETEQAIRCSDISYRTANETEVAVIAKDVFAETERFAAAQVNGITLVCPQWPFTAKESFAGNFSRTQLKTPMLVIGNVFDPVTSLDGARTTTATWNNSVLLVQQGYGYSKCKSDAVAAYFNQGKLPDAETVCLVDTPTLATADEVKSAAAQLFSKP
nr:tripeptidyl aminopeptidase [Quercus suber]